MIKKLNSVLYYGLFVLAFVLPISIAATNIVWITLFLVWIVKVIHTKKTGYTSPMTLPILVFFAATLISALFGIDFIHGIKKMNSEMLFVIFFLVVANVKDFNHAKKVIFIFIISSSVSGLLGVLQYCRGGWVEHAEFFSMLEGRAHGTRSWSQTYVEGLLMALPISIYAVLYSKRKIFYLAAITIFSGIVFGYVRMIWISTAIILALMFILEFRKLKGLLYIFAGTLVLAVISAIILTNRRDIIKRAMDFNEPVRIGMWKTAVEIFKDYPVFGVGKENIKNEKILPSYYAKLNIHPSYRKLSHLHSNFMHILAERGLLGIIAFFYLFGSYLYYGGKKILHISRDEKYFVFGCWLGIFGFLLSGFTEFSYGDSEVQMIVWFLMALTFYKSRAVFLDRDDTINEDMRYSADISKFKIYNNAVPAMRILSKAGYKIIIVTNQSGIARGYFTKDDADVLNKIVVEKAREGGVVINGVYICPHHPDDKCSCRKPNTGMILKARKDLNIDIENSYVVGDAQSDIDLAKNAGAKSVAVLTGSAKKDVKGADYTAKDILDAANWIIKQENVN
ncbi:MAG: HAD-IIIA family hydrolase [Elusimicrobia bacterium]|nr:HAD-IIIA family hydrolase [Elusimicrobiota bacterium]